jgi:glycolate oxidase FAD binding subunit
MTAPAATRPPSRAEREHLGADSDVATPATRDELAGAILAAEARGEAVVPAGEGAHAGWADPPPPGARVVSAAAFDGVASYEPDDFTIGVGAGMRLADLRALLRSHGQEIPFEWPGGGTVGGLVARGAAGARQGRYGPLGSFVLGVEGVRGEGRPFRSGGMVVKNVAGYQVHKLVVGSLGRAGFLLRINFKVRPLPARRRLGVALCSTEAAAWKWASELRAAGLEPAALLVLGGAARKAVSAAEVPPADAGAAVAWVFEGSAASACASPEPPRWRSTSGRTRPSSGSWKPPPRSRRRRAPPRPTSESRGWPCCLPSCPTPRARWARRSPGFPRSPRARSRTR